MFAERHQEELEDTKGVIRIHKSTKNRKHNRQKDKQRSTKHTHKAKDRVARTPLKPGGELRVQLNARENRRDNKEWTIQRHWGRRQTKQNKHYTAPEN